jgi:NDP-sugar pyrophosphorylase family protein
MAIGKVRSMVQRGRVHTAILAGGFGTRTDAISDPARNKWAVAKPVAPVGNLRIIEFTIRSLRKIELEKFNLLVCHLPHTIRHAIGDGKIYGPNVEIRELVESNSDPLDTAGAVGRLVHNRGWANNPGDLVIVPGTDIIHTIDIEQLLDRHLFNREKHGAVATIAVNPVPWESVKEFGTVRLEDMPRREDCKSDNEFEDKIGAWLIDHRSASAKILEFREKKPRDLDMKLSEEERYKEVCLSNINNSSIYVFEATFFKNLFPMLTKRKSAPLLPELYKPGGPIPFSDFGKHVFKWLTEKAQLENHPFYAYVTGENEYWRDAGIGQELRLANMDVLDGKVDTGLKEGESTFWFRGKNESWHGRNVFIHPSAYVSRSLIGDNVIIGPDARIIHSVIGSDTEIEEGVQMWGTVIFPKHRDKKEQNVIGANSEITDCLVLGGTLFPKSEFRNVELYDPVGGLAIGSLLGQTRYLIPEGK